MNYYLASDLGTPSGQTVLGTLNGDAIRMRHPSR